MALPSYLEPVYLNEKMLLNGAAYLFEDPTRSEEVLEEFKKRANMRAGLRLPWLGLGDIGGEAGGESVVQHKYSREVSSAALHMDLVNALLDDNNLRVLTSGQDVQAYVGSGSKEPYVAVRAQSAMSDYPALLHAIKIGMPVTSAIATVWNRRARSQDGGGRKSTVKADSTSTIANWLKTNQDEVSRVASELESDYYSSGSTQLIMADVSGRADLIGVADFAVDGSLSGRDVSARLAGGHYWIIGKTIETVESDDSIDLLQGTVLSTVLGLVENILSIEPVRQQMPLPITTDDMLGSLNDYIRLRVDGPAIRIVALSACI